QWYHRRWQQDDTTDNFFKWLDRGAGKNINLDECPRERLNKEASIISSLALSDSLTFLLNMQRIV
ncbi:uncharacterized protein EDB91DRAFT_1046979, partial [Suillus paluster]|uniref:uncharacterized protein n=1 Tax=Suillus paluster TaxID=48578 RepID=UPI001B876CA7